MKRKEVDIMTTATILRNEEFKFANEMEEYVEEIKNKRKLKGEAECRKEALAALKRTGVVTKNGNTRKKIVSWE